METAALAAGKGWIPIVMLAACAMTGGALLRVTGRVFLGLGREPGVENESPTERDVEKAGRPLWVMLLPACALMTTALLLPYGLGHVDHDTALSIAAFSLSRIRPLSFMTPAFRALQSLHCANVGDYVTWQSVGLSAFVLAFAYL